MGPDPPVGPRVDAVSPRDAVAGPVDVAAWWVGWCALHDVDPDRASIANLHDLALDLRLAGVPDVALVEVVEHAAEARGWWGTSEWATLRLSLPV